MMVTNNDEFDVSKTKTPAFVSMCIFVYFCMFVVVSLQSNGIFKIKRHFAKPEAKKKKKFINNNIGTCFYCY